MNQGIGMKPSKCGADISTDYFDRINLDNEFNNVISPFMAIHNMIENSKRKTARKLARMTPEERIEYDIEKAEREARWKIREEQLRVNKCINANVCPNNDNGHLIRGNKEKNNNYKRPFVCIVCGNKFYRED